MKPVIKFALISLAAVFAIFGLTWVLLDVGIVELGFHGTVALLLGVVLSTILGVGLMALIFFSNRSGQDERVGRGPGPGAN